MNPDVERYLALWKLKHPQGVVSKAYLTDRDDPLVRLHRRAWLTGRPGIPAPARLALEGWLATRWLARSSRHAAMTANERLMAKYEQATGIPPQVQQKLLRQLARAHGIPPIMAYRFNLLGEPGRWPEYVFDYEVGWNSAASEGLPNRDADIADIQNKAASARRLGAQAIPVIEAEVLPAGQRTPEEVGALVAGWLERWPEVFVKRRDGSRGEGSFRIEPVPADGGVPLAGHPKLPWRVVEYQGGAPAGEPREFIAGLLATHPYLVQPRLRTHPMFDGLAGDEDVVTIRIVTRQIGGAISVFSAALEVPLNKAHGQPQTYNQLVVSASGGIGDTVLPPWLRVSPEELSLDDLVEEAEETPHEREARLEVRRAEMRAAQAVADALHGRTIPDMAGLHELAIRAHREFAGIYALAWDVALTDGGDGGGGDGSADSGWRFLEGNTGFGTRLPQLISGGLLRGWSPR